MSAASLLLLLLLFTSYCSSAAFLGHSFLYYQTLFRNGGFFQSVMNITGSFPHARRPRRNPYAFAPTRSPTPHRRKHRHGHHHHRSFPVEMAPAPSEQECSQVCEEPYTSNPFGSPCGCVLPMKVRLILHVAPYAIFPVMNELEAEIASGTYLEQSQVKIMGATADGLNQGRTLVDIDLVPLGEKFDNTTALLMYQRLENKKVPLNATLFGTYEVLYAVYPGLPVSSRYNVTGPSSSSSNLPITANFNDASQKLSPRTIAVISSAGFVLVLLLMVAMGILIRWRKFGRPSSAVGPAVASSLNKRSGMNSFLSSSIESSTPVSIMSSIPACMLSVKTFGYVELDKATNKFSPDMLLGEGGFGRVYRGVMEDDLEVAVKLLNRHQNGDREFVAEVEMLSRLHHRNLVKLIGICVQGYTRCLVYELVRNGSVESHLHGADKEKSPLDWDARLKIALGAGRALAYLHEDSNPRVIHRDFKASNVLLEDDFTPKVSDFGLAREATEGTEHVSTRVMGTFGYVAPEYAMTGHLLVKSDVYSYGVMLLELLSGRKPVDMRQARGQENLVTWARPLLGSREGVCQLADPALRGGYDAEDMERVAAIAAMCVAQDVGRRPFMGEVVQALKLICHDADDTCSPKESSALESDMKAPSDTSWWNAGGISPALRYTMEYSSDCVPDRESLPLSHGNRSGPLKTVRCKTRCYRLRATRSDHGSPRSRSHWL